MKLNRKTKNRRISFAGAMKTVALVAVSFAALLLHPLDASATITYGGQVSYQDVVNNNGTVKNSQIQQRYGLFLSLAARPNSRLSVLGDFKLDILKSKAGRSSSTDLQPNLGLRLSTRALQTGLGYRFTRRDDSTILGNKTSNLLSSSKELFVDNSLQLGKFPNIKLRYSTREQDQKTDGTTNSNTATSDFTASLGYALGILSMNADYRTQMSKDKVNAVKTDQTVLNLQASLAKNLGSKVSLNIRDIYSYQTQATSGVPNSKRYNNVGEARANIIPFKSMNISTDYIIRNSDDQLANNASLSEKVWFTSLNYSFRNSLRLYGSYNTRTSDSADRDVKADSLIGGVGLAHRLSVFNLTARYERKYDSSSTAGAGSTTKTIVNRDNFDWLINANLSRYFKVDLSQSYVKNSSAGNKDSADRFRVRATIGPVKSFVVGPSLDYSISSPVSGPGSYTTDVNIPASFKVDLHRKLTLSIADNYRWGTSESAGLKRSSRANNLTARLDVITPVPNFILGGDAGFSSSSTMSSGTTSSSSAATYNVRATWAGGRQTVSGNYRYQTSSGAPDITGFTFQYGVGLTMRKFLVSFQARYNYAMTYSKPHTSSQDIYLLLRVKK